MFSGTRDRETMVWIFVLGGGSASLLLHFEEDFDPSF